MRKKVSYLLLMLSSLVYSQSDVSYSIQAHADDWQLFMSSNIINDLESAKVIFITLSAGDGGYGNGGSGIIPYYLARERGSVYSAKFASDFWMGNPEIVPNAQIVNINGHNITKYVYKNNVVNYFLRLPDGKNGTDGFPINGGQTLYKLKYNLIDKIYAVDGSSVYDGWTDLVNTVGQIIDIERGCDDYSWINKTSTNGSYNPNDHSDHYMTGYLSEDIANSRSWIGLAEWVNYATSNQSNLSKTQHQNATALFALNVWGLIENGYTSQFNEDHKIWLAGDLYRIQKYPIPQSVCKLIKNNLNTLESNKENPFYIYLNNPYYNNNSFEFYFKSPVERGNIKYNIFDNSGRLISEGNSIVNLGMNEIKIKNIMLVSGVYYLRVFLNDGSFQTKKIKIN